MLRRNNSSNAEQRQQDDLVKQLAMIMDINLDVAQYAASKVQYRSIEEAIEYLVEKDNGLFRHEFFPFTNKKCFLCKEDVS
jgi:hypothetical protein